MTPAPAFAVIGGGTRAMTSLLSERTVRAARAAGAVITVAGTEMVTTLGAPHEEIEVELAKDAGFS